MTRERTIRVVLEMAADTIFRSLACCVTACVATTALDQGVSAFERKELLVIEAFGRPPAVLDVTVPAGQWKVADMQGLRGALELRDVTGHAFLPCDCHALMPRRFTSDCDNAGNRQVRECERYCSDVSRRVARQLTTPPCSNFVSHSLETQSIRRRPLS
jgi:hypothetical protein